MMKTALFLMVPHLNHYFPTFGLTRLLQRQGYTIIYSRPAPHQSTVESEGFLFGLMGYLEEFVVRKPSVAFGLWMKGCLDPTYMKAHYRRFLTSMYRVGELVADSKPTLIFIDDTLGHYYSCLAVKATRNAEPLSESGPDRLGNLAFPLNDTAKRLRVVVQGVSSEGVPISFTWVLPVR